MQEELKAQLFCQISQQFMINLCGMQSDGSPTTQPPPCRASRSSITLQNSLPMSLPKTKITSYLFLCLNSSCHVIKYYHVIEEDLEGVCALQCSAIMVNSSFMASEHHQSCSRASRASFLGSETQLVAVSMKGRKSKKF